MFNSSVVDSIDTHESNMFKSFRNTGDISYIKQLSPSIVNQLKLIIKKYLVDSYTSNKENKEAKYEKGIYKILSNYFFPINLCYNNITGPVKITIMGNKELRKKVLLLSDRHYYRIFSSRQDNIRVDKFIEQIIEYTPGVVDLFLEYPYLKRNLKVGTHHKNNYLGIVCHKFEDCFTLIKNSRKYPNLRVHYCDIRECPTLKVVKILNIIKDMFLNLEELSWLTFFDTRSINMKLTIQNIDSAISTYEKCNINSINDLFEKLYEDMNQVKLEKQLSCIKDERS